MERSRPHCWVASFTIMLCLVPSIVRAGFNAGGTIIVHYHNALVSTCDPPPYHGALGDCQRAVVKAPGALVLPSPCSEYQLWYAYAAFPPGSRPQLKGITFGIDYPPLVNDRGIRVIASFRDPDAYEMKTTSPPWPQPNSGTALVFANVMTELVDPIYAFVGYGTPGQVFRLRTNPEPSWGGMFGDDYVPSHLDNIAGFGSMGFETDGSLPCPGPALASCCLEDGGCVVLSPVDCAAQGSRPLFPGLGCDPNPCRDYLEACCLSDGTCYLDFGQYCGRAGGYSSGPRTLCSPYPCILDGACCYPDGTCLYIPHVQCPTGDWEWGRLCYPTNPCSVPEGACCDPRTGECRMLTSAQCGALGPLYQWMGPNSTCAPNPCIPTPIENTTWGRIKHRYR